METPIKRQLSGRELETKRLMEAREDRFWERESKDFVPGRDDGEPPKGAYETNRA